MRNRKYIQAAQTSLANALTYKAAVFSRFVFYALFITIFFNLWRFIYQDGAIEGFSLIQIVWYLCCTELIVFSSRASVLDTVDQDVKSGAIAYQLSRPYDFVVYQFALSVGEIALSFTAFGALAVVMGLLTVGPIPGFDWAGLPIGIFSMLLGVGLHFFLYLCATLSSLWIEDSFGVKLILQKFIFMLGVFIPVEFLPVWMQSAARLLPFSYIAWAPARLIVNFSWDFVLQTIPVQIAWLAVFVMLARFMYRRGMAALEAHGG